MKRGIISILCALCFLALCIDFSVIINAKEASPRTAYVFIGDSRTVGMDKAVKLSDMKDTYVIAEVGKGYSWYKNTALKQFNEIYSAQDYDKYVVLCNLGVNDLNNIEDYVTVKNDFEQENVEFYWVSVNPTIDSCGGVQCADICAFNRRIESLVTKDFYIDTYTYLISNGFNAPDGLHYDKDTYAIIYHYIMLDILSTHIEDVK